VSHATPKPRMLRGDEAQLYREHHADLEHSVRRVVNGPQACTQDACSFAWLQLLRCQPDRETVFGWLSVVAIREGWRLVARERRDGHLEQTPAWNDRCGQADLDLAVAAREGLATLAALPERQRRYLELLIAGYSYDEITELCDVTYTNVNKHLVRARSTLRDATSGLN
jgi:DNA-directed RNA polymerase specialized sigma24 family protein